MDIYMHIYMKIYMNTYFNICMNIYMNIQIYVLRNTGRLKKIDLLYLFDISGTKKRISKPFFSSENWDPFVNFEYRTIPVRY